MCEGYEETKERRRSDENSEKKCVVIFSDFLPKVKCCNYVFRYFRQNGTFFREMAFVQCFLDYFVFFVVKR